MLANSSVINHCTTSFPGIIPVFFISMDALILLAFDVSIFKLEYENVV